MDIHGLLIIPLLASALLVTDPARGADDPVALAIGRLGAETFAEREAAHQSLMSVDDHQTDRLLKACADEYRRSQDPEVQYRLKAIMEHVVTTRVFQKPCGFLGVRIDNFNTRLDIRMIGINGMDVPAHCVRVADIIANTAAAKAGLQANDMIVAIDDKPWTRETPEGFTELIQSKQPGTAVKLTFLREGQTNQVSATLGEIPAAERETFYTPQRARKFFATWWRDNVEQAPPAP